MFLYDGKNSLWLGAFDPFQYSLIVFSEVATTVYTDSLDLRYGIENLNCKCVAAIKCNWFYVESH